MSSISTGYNPRIDNDTLQDYQPFVHKSLEGSASILTSTPDQPSNAVLIDNCSPCPVLATITFLDASDKTGATTFTRNSYFKPYQSRTLDYKDDVIVSVTTDEADTTSIPDDAATSIDSLTGVGTASKELLVFVDYFNC